jgi:hypothetical protein
MVEQMKGLPFLGKYIFHQNKLFSSKNSELSATFLVYIYTGVGFLQRLHPSFVTIQERREEWRRLWTFTTAWSKTG